MTAAVVELDRRARLQERRAKLRALRKRLDDEIRVLEVELGQYDAAERAETERVARNAANRRWRAKRREAAKLVEAATSDRCGTAAGYDWHRINGPWPLPIDDPCGCRAAHAEAERARAR